MAKTASPEPEQVPADSVRCLDRSASSTNSRDKRPRNRYATEPARLLGVLDERLAGRDWMMGADYSIADISLLSSARNLIGFYEAREIVGFDRLLHVPAWLDCGLARPAEQRRLEVTSGQNGSAKNEDQPKFSE